MSGGKRGKTPIARLVDAFGLVLVFGILTLSVRLSPVVGDQASLISALGFLLLAGILMSELVEVLGIPHLTGYLFAGILAGPHVLHLLDVESLHRLRAVNTLAIALIALAGGAELRLENLKRGLKSLAIAQCLQTFVGIAIMTGVFFAIRPSFVRNMTTTGVLGVGILWGVLAITRSPSALLGILSQTRASGPLARFALQFIMTSDVVVVVVLSAAITVARPLIDPATAMSFAQFRSLGHEMLGSVAIGTTLGLVLAAYLKLGGHQLLIVLVALGFGATEILHYLNFEPLLTFLVAGFVVQNLSNQGPKFLHAIEGTGGVVYVVFFAGAGADLDVPLLKEYWPIALLLTGARFAVTYGLGRVASHLAKDAPVVKAWGWAPLISQAGVAIGIATMTARSFPAFGKEFGAIALACIALNELAGPVLFKFALDRVKESKPASLPLPEAEDAPSPPA
jgi:Kef-type K+ transport system membrane component KefB